MPLGAASHRTTPSASVRRVPSASDRRINSRWLFGKMVPAAALNPAASSPARSSIEPWYSIWSSTSDRGLTAIVPPCDHSVSSVSSMSTRTRNGGRSGLGQVDGSAPSASGTGAICTLT